MADRDDAPPRHSAAADAAAIRWSERHPEDDVDHDAPPGAAPTEEGVPNRHSASAESAAERLHRREEG
ncbi:MAG TPA: hypothetical protein VGI54_11755 [Solirubrobacteraceae bacterium]